MAILQNYPECTELLLAQGADVMVKDDDSRTALHLAAEIDAKHVHAILEHCRNNAREIIIENEDLWKPELENKPDAKIISYLLAQLNMMYDNQGYTPLMLASNMGDAAAVELLVSAAPSTVNMTMPTCGNTALYLAAGAACTEAATNLRTIRLSFNEQGDCISHSRLGVFNVIGENVICTDEVIGINS